MFFRKKDIIGLDIGSSSIKLVQLKEEKNSFRLERLGIANVPPEVIVEGSILDSSKVVDTISELITTTDIQVKNVTLSVSGHSSVIIKRIAMQQMSEEDLEESIKFEAEQYIPFDIEDVNIDFQILGPGETENTMDVLIVAVKKDKVNEYVAVVHEAGLNPVIVDVDAFALENMYELNYEIKDGNVALVNVGASTININIIKGGVSVFTRDSSVGGNLITEALQREFTLSYEDAEKLKFGETIKGISIEDAKAVISSACDDIITEIARSFDYYRDTTNYENIDEIVLSGGATLTEGFVTQLSNRSGVNVIVADPFKNIEIPEGFDREYLKKTGPLVGVAVGLALRRIGDR